MAGRRGSCRPGGAAGQVRGEFSGHLPPPPVSVTGRTADGRRLPPVPPAVPSAHPAGEAAPEPAIPPSPSGARHPARSTAIRSTLHRLPPPGDRYPDTAQSAAAGRPHSHLRNPASPSCSPPARRPQASAPDAGGREGGSE